MSPAMSEKPAVYNLAWYGPNLPDCDRFLVYVLVPVWLGIFSGANDFESINSCGRPLDKVRATTKELASPRRREDTEGVGHPLEIQLIRALTFRAGQAGHILPQVVPSVAFRGWSRLALSEKDRGRLFRAGGALPLNLGLP